MKTPFKKTIVIDDQAAEANPAVPLIAFAGGEPADERDVSKPVGVDEQGRPLYAPRGITFRLD
jgi:hypothetical protein